MFERSGSLVRASGLPEADGKTLLTAAGFADWELALVRLREMAVDDESRAALADVLPMLLMALSDAATPDASLLGIAAYVQCVPDRTVLLRYLASRPRAVEMLVKLFVGSQFLTEILLRNPDYLEKLTNHKRLSAEFKSRHQFTDGSCSTCWPLHKTLETASSMPSARHQRWSYCAVDQRYADAFGLLDLKSVTVQLSLLADSLVQVCLSILAPETKPTESGFAVIAMGKLGGAELNYSSDIDLIFLCREDASRFWSLGQRLTGALTDSTGEGFLYRVDMRLRPWGRSGALVNTVDGHIAYLKTHGMLWSVSVLLRCG